MENEDGDKKIPAGDSVVATAEYTGMIGKHTRQPRCGYNYKGNMYGRDDDPF